MNKVSNRQSISVSVTGDTSDAKFRLEVSVPKGGYKNDRLADFCNDALVSTLGQLTERQVVESYKSGCCISDTMTDYNCLPDSFFQNSCDTGMNVKLVKMVCFEFDYKTEESVGYYPTEIEVDKSC